MPILIVLLPFAAGCEAVATATPQATATLYPYRTEPPTPAADETLKAPQTEVPLGPTPTPLVHIVQQGETLLGIASRFGVDLEDILLINPGVDPRFLSIGQEILIPGEGGEAVSALLPTPTPVPLGLRPPVCYVDAMGQDLWCLMMVTNRSSSYVEGATAVVQLLGQDGDLVQQAVAYPPLTFIAPEGTMPLLVRLAVPSELHFSAVAKITAAVRVDEPPPQYLPVELIDREVAILDDGRDAVIRGRVALSVPEAGEAFRARLVAVGIGASGDLVGMAITERAMDGSQSGETELDLTLFSLGPRIESVSLYAEALAISP